MVAPIAAKVVQRLGAWTPFAFALLAVLLSLVPVSLPGGLEMTPLYPLIVVYFWGTHRPDLMTPLPIFLTGIAMDLLTGAPLGLWALAFLAGHGLAIVLRAFFATLLRSAWAGFAVTCAAVSILAWGLGSLYLWQPLGFLPFAVQALMSIALYPFFGLLFAYVERRLLVAVRA